MSLLQTGSSVSSSALADLLRIIDPPFLALLKNGWQHRDRVEPAVKIELRSASDASNRGYGGVCLDTGIEILRRRWTPTEDELHINVKELVAAIAVIDLSLGRHPLGSDGKTRLWLGIDFSTARAWLKGLWCRDVRVNGMLQEAAKRWQQLGCILEPVQLSTKIMVADAASRGDHMSLAEGKQKLEACNKEIDTAQEHRVSMSTLRLQKRVREESVEVTLPGF